jgi:hypothetical protein
MRIIQVVLSLLAIVGFTTALPGHHDQGQAENIEARALPSSFTWSSSDALVSAKNDGRGIAGIKDPSIIYYDNKYHVFASMAQSSGHNLVCFNFTDFSEADNATFYYLNQSPIGTGYRAAPEVFYFAPKISGISFTKTATLHIPRIPTLTTPADGLLPQTSTAACQRPLVTILAAGIGSTCGSFTTRPTATCSHPTTTATFTARRHR